jgi:enoyl-CoA hydratase/carnithine racemase
VELGLATRVVSDGNLFETATATAQKLAAKPGSALLATKRLIKQAALQQVQEAVKSENQTFFAQVSSAEAKEAFSAFLEKRPPDFTKIPKG